MKTHAETVPMHRCRRANAVPIALALTLSISGALAQEVVVPANSSVPVEERVRIGQETTLKRVDKHFARQAKRMAERFSARASKTANAEHRRALRAMATHWRAEGLRKRAPGKPGPRALLP